MRSFINVIKKSFTFEAAHQLMRHDGKCARLHGHSYKMTLYFERESLDQTGSSTHMVFDFGKISEAVKPFIDEHLDHRFLNETLHTESPTAEFIAQYIFGYFHFTLPYLAAVEIDETCTASAMYAKIPVIETEDEPNIADKLPE